MFDLSYLLPQAERLLENVRMPMVRASVDCAMVTVATKAVCRSKWAGGARRRVFVGVDVCVCKSRLGLQVLCFYMKAMVRLESNATVDSGSGRVVMHAGTRSRSTMVCTCSYFLVVAEPMVECGAAVLAGGRLSVCHQPSTGSHCFWAAG